MDDNKEILTPENEAEEVSAEENTEKAENAQAETEEAARKAEAVSENAEEAETEKAEEAEAVPEDTEAAPAETETAVTPEAFEVNEVPAPESKGTLQRTILISAGIVICAVLAAIVCRLFLFHGVVDTDLFGNSKETTWHYTAELQSQMTSATSDEPLVANYYFMFEPDGTLKIEIGTFDYYGNYSIRYLTDEEISSMAVSDENAKRSVLDIQNTNSIDGIYFYDVSGNAFSEKTMTITSVSNENVKYDYDNKAYEPAGAKREGEFKKDDAIVGSWTNKNEVASQTLTFNKDGSYSIETKTAESRQSERGLYSCENGKVKLISYYISPQSQEFKYKVEKDKLVITQEIVLGDQTIEQPIEYNKD